MKFQKRTQPIGFYPLPLNKPDHAVWRNAFNDTGRPDNLKNNVIYVHIPFCTQTCAFCFFHESNRHAALLAGYFAALKAEMEHAARSPFVKHLSFSAMFVGGGTPSILSPEQIKDLIESIRKNFSLEKNFEITMEWHPQDNHREKFVAAKENGISRLSFGVQSFNDRMSKILRLPSTPENKIKTIETALELGFESVNIDIISCIPSQKIEELKEDIDFSHAFKGGFLSVNPLEVIPHTPLKKLVEKSKVESPFDDFKKIEYIKYVDQYLLDLGYVQQRFHNFHLPGKQHRYNRHSTRFGANTLAFGAGAYGVINNVAYFNEDNIGKYITTIKEGKSALKSMSSIPSGERERMFIVNSLLERSLSQDEYATSFGRELMSDFGSVIDEHVRKGLFEINERTISFTRAAEGWEDSICASFYSEQQAEILNARFNEEEARRHYAPLVAETA